MKTNETRADAAVAGGWHVKTNETRADAAVAESPEARIAEKIAWLETCDTALEASGIAVLKEVFPTLMRVHHDWVWRRVRKWDVPEARAEELVQDVFIAFFRRVRDHGGKGGLRRELGKITKGKLINYMRDERRAPDTVGLPSSGSALPESDVDVDRALDLRELARRFLPALSPAHRAVVEKAVLGDLTDAETAAALGLHEGTVKSRLRAATRVLKALGAPWLPSSQRNAP